MPPHLPGTVLPVLLCVPFLMGCAQTRTELRVERPEIPVTLLQCRPRPDVPVGGTDADIALWIEELGSAGEDCRSRLAQVRVLVAPVRAPP